MIKQDKIKLTITDKEHLGKIKKSLTVTVSNLPFTNKTLVEDLPMIIKTAIDKNEERCQSSSESH